MNKHLKTLFPLPKKWDNDERKFGQRLEDAYRELQTGMKTSDVGELKSAVEALQAKFKTFAISYSGSGTIALSLTVKNSSRIRIDLFSASGTRRGSALVYSNSSGDIGVTEIEMGSKVHVYEQGANTLLIETEDGGTVAECMIYAGDINDGINTF